MDLSWLSITRSFIPGDEKGEDEKDMKNLEKFFRKAHINTHINTHKNKSLYLLLGGILTFVLSGCAEQRDTTLERLLKLDDSQYSGQEASEERIEELKETIKKYKGIVEEKLEAAAQLGVYYKMLATAYMDNEMYGLALEQLQFAMDVYPANPILYYYAGVCSANLVKAKMDSGDREDLYREAERLQEAALSLDSRYVDALYALSVLYIFEFEEGEMAIPYLVRIMEKEQYNFDAMFLLARVYLTLGKSQAALDLYDRIIENTADPAKKEQALKNRAWIEEGGFEGP